MYLNKIKIKLRFFIHLIFKKKEIKFSAQKRVYLLLTPIHGNLGDQAIRYTENKFLIDNFKGYEIVEISLKDTPDYLLSIKANISSDDIIFLHGGGNLGDLYYIEEYYRTKVVETLLNNTIISFPQSLAYKKPIDLKIVNQSKRVYKKNSNFKMSIRESNSAMLFEQLFEMDYIFCPDIVLYNDVEYSTDKKEEVLILFRNDAETLYDSSYKDKLILWINQEGYETIQSDTHIGINISNCDINRYTELFLKIDEIKQSKLVITDRLHGMILSYLSGVPCLVLDNTTKKISYCYKDWFKECDTVEILESDIDKSDFLHLINKLYGKTGNNLHINEEFRELFHEYKN